MSAMGRLFYFASKRFGQRFALCIPFQPQLDSFLCFLLLTVSTLVYSAV